MTASSELEREYCRDKEKNQNLPYISPYMGCVSNVRECITGSPILRCDGLRDGTQRKGRLAEMGREISISDLVWCKIRGPYWWPGKLIGSSAGVMKDYFLVVCFGVQAPGPVRVSRIKPLWEHFPLMEMQSSTDKLHYAVDCALDELSRRAEYVLTCRCVPREVQTGFRAQAEVNAASVKNLSKWGPEDSVLTTACFTPRELVMYMKIWGESPHGGPSRLLLSVAKSQLLAFSRWKGFSQLPEFISFGGKLENEADMTELEDCYQNPIEIDGAIPQFEGCHGMLAVKKTGCCISNLSEHKNSFQDGKHPGRKRKTCVALWAENCWRNLIGEVGSGKRTCGNSILFGEAAGPNESVSPCTGAPTMISTDQSLHIYEQNDMAMCGFQRKTECHISNSNKLKHISLDVVPLRRKRKGFPALSKKSSQDMWADEVLSDEGTCRNSFDKAAVPNESIAACTDAPATISVDQSMQFKQNHRAIHRIHKVPRESNGSLPLTEHLKESPSGRSNKNTGLIPHDSCSRRNLIEYVLPKQILLWLHLLASNPMIENTFPICMVRYFSEFRNVVVPDHLLLNSCGESPQEASVVETRSSLTNFGITEPMDLKCSKDSVRTSSIIRSIQEPRLPLENWNAGDSQLEIPCERPVPSVVMRMDRHFCPAFTQGPQLPNENPPMEVKKPIHDVSGTRMECSKDQFSTGKTIEHVPVQQLSFENQNAGDSLIESERHVASIVPQMGQFRRPLIHKLQVRRPKPGMMVKRPNNDIPATVLECSKDSFLSKQIMQSIPKQQPSLGNQNAEDFLLEAPHKKPVSSMESQTNLQLCPVLIQKLEAPCMNPYVEEKHPSDVVSQTALECSDDTFMTGRMIQSTPEQKVLLKNEENIGDSVLETPSKQPAHPTEPQVNCHYGPALIQEAQFPSENPYAEVKKPETDIPGSSNEDFFPTALVLTFTNLNLAPSVTKLNKMFSCFGPLKESESKVLNKSKQVKIVFKNRTDAETAFVRLGEHRIFGPLLRSYRLKYVRSCFLEAPPPHVGRRNKKRQQDKL